MIHQYLSERSYWAFGRTFNEVTDSIHNSMCFGAYDTNGNQVGFARVITDKVIFAWILDVFVLEKYQRQGIGKKLLQTIVEHPELQSIKRMSLGTKDAHGLYRQFGFTALKKPENMMERMDNKQL